MKGKTSKKSPSSLKGKSYTVFSLVNITEEGEAEILSFAKSKQEQKGRKGVWSLQ